MGEGLLLPSRRDECLEDEFQHAFARIYHVGVPKADQPLATLFQKAGPLGVGLWRVLPAIKFYDQHGFEAGKICHIGSDRPLTAKLMSGELAIAKRLPDDLFDIRGGLPKRRGVPADLATNWVRHPTLL